MTPTPLTVLELAGLCALVLIVVGFGSLFLGLNKARREFRSKGFLRPPSGTAWFRFLLLRQYEYFENTTIRACFGTSHVCLIISFFVLGALALFFGTEYMFNGINGISLTGPGAPTIPLPE
jgi:hypothetical protein